MARVDWVKRRLDNWARWKVAQSAGGLGFASQAAFLRDDPSGGGREARIPVDEIEASVTDDGVQSLRAGKPHLFRTLECIYPLGKGVVETARAMNISESTVHAHLGQADQLLKKWFLERDEKRAGEAAAFRNRVEALRSGKLPQGGFTS